jgi:hypothetical protein
MQRLSGLPTLSTSSDQGVSTSQTEYTLPITLDRVIVKCGASRRADPVIPNAELCTEGFGLPPSKLLTAELLMRHKEKTSSCILS